MSANRLTMPIVNTNEKAAELDAFRTPGIAHAGLFLYIDGLMNSLLGAHPPDRAFIPSLGIDLCPLRLGWFFVGRNEDHIRHGIDQDKVIAYRFDAGNVLRR